MNDVELRQACVVTRQRMNRCVELDGTIDVLMAFAKRMQAAGVRSVLDEMTNQRLCPTCKWMAAWGINELKRLEGES